MSKIELTSKEKLLIERVIGYPILKERDIEVTMIYHWIEPKAGPRYQVDKNVVADGIELIPEGAATPFHKIPKEAIYLAEKGNIPYVYPCDVCLERSKKYKEEHGYSLHYGSLIVFKTKEWRRQWCTNPDCQNNIVEMYGKDENTYKEDI